MGDWRLELEQGPASLIPAAGWPHDGLRTVFFRRSTRCQSRSAAARSSCRRQFDARPVVSDLVGI
eukprot:3794642-Pyramimonas_sp.AAC.1